MSPAEVIREVKTARLRGRGGAGFPTGMKWEFTRAADGDRALPRVQRRRGRAGHLQGPRRPHRAARPAVRGHDHRRLRDRRRARACSTCAASTPTCASTWSSVLAERRASGLLGARDLRQGGLRLRHPHPDGRRRLRLRRGDRAALLLRGHARRPEEPAAVPGAARLSRPSDLGQQRRDALLRAAHPRAGLRLVRLDRLAQEHRHQAAQHLGRLHAARRLRGAVRHRACARCSRCAAPRSRWPCRSAARAARWSAPPSFDREICFDDLATGGALVVFGAERDPLEIASQLHGVLRPRELRLLHALPGRQRAAQGAARPHPRRARRGRGPRLSAVARRDRQDGEPLRARPDLAQPGAVHASRTSAPRYEELLDDARATAASPASTSPRGSPRPAR